MIDTDRSRIQNDRLLKVKDKEGQKNEIEMDWYELRCINSDTFCRFISTSKIEKI